MYINPKFAKHKTESEVSVYVLARKTIIPSR